MWMWTWTLALDITLWTVTMMKILLKSYANFEVNSMICELSDLYN